MTLLPHTLVGVPDPAAARAEAASRVVNFGATAQQEELARLRREEQLEAEVKAYGELGARASELAKKREHDFSIPSVPGEGWATASFRDLLQSLAWRAKESFTRVVGREERVKVAKAALARNSSREATSGLLVKPEAQAQELDFERSRLDEAEAVFETDYAALELQRARLNEPGFAALLDEGNAIAQKAFFEEYLAADMPEVAAIHRAIAAYAKSVDSIVEKQAAMLAANSRGCAIAQQLGLKPPDNHSRRLSMYLAEGFIKNAVARAVLATGGALASSPDQWIPDGNEIVGTKVWG